MQGGLPVIGFVGPSSAGKTSLLESLLCTLEHRGLSVGVVKHSCHSVRADQPGKDSARLYAAGADAVALAASNQVVTFVRRETPPQLADALVGLPADLDIILVEGFSWEQIPRYLVLPEDFAPVARYTESGPVLGTIIVKANRQKGKPLFPVETLEELAHKLASLAESRGLADSRPSQQETRSSPKRFG